MGSDESYEYVAHNEFYYYYQSIVVSLDIEYISLVSDIVS